MERFARYANHFQPQAHIDSAAALEDFKVEVKVRNDRRLALEERSNAVKRDNIFKYLIKGACITNGASAFFVVREIAHACI